MSTHVDSSPLCDRCSCSQVPPTPIPEPKYMANRRTNILPAEKSALLAFISEAEKRLSLYDAEATRLADFTKKLECERLQMRCAIDHCRSILAPVAGQRRRVKRSHIQRLPVELLAEIFKVCSDGEGNPFLPEPVGLAPLNLALVCRLWRSIALSAPKLWSALSICVDDDVAERTAGIVELYLERSGGSPLSIDMVHSDQGYHHPLGYCVARSVAKECRRIRRLRMWGNITIFDQFFKPEDLVMLETLELDDPLVKWSLSDGQRSSFKHCLTLQSLHLRDCPLSWVTSRIPFERITSLKVVRTGHPIRCMESVNDLKALQIMEHFPNLQHATLNIYYSEPKNNIHISLQHLATLSLTVNMADEEYEYPPGGALKHFFKSVTLPSLASVSIMSGASDSDMECDTWVPYAFRGMLTRSQCVLKDITLEDIFITESQLLQLFQSVPSLIDFTYLERDDLLETAVTADLLDRLNLCPVSSYSDDEPPSDSIVLLPNLKRLEFALAPPFVDSDLLADMIESRWTPMSSLSTEGSGSACLEEVDLTFATPIDQDVEKRLRDFGTNGLRVWIS